MEKISLAEKVLGVHSLNHPNAIYETYRHLTDPKLDLQTFEDEGVRLDAYDLDDWQNIPIDEREHLTTRQILQQIFDDRQVRYYNVLQHWPTYEASYSRIEAASPQESPRQALQIGCLTALSAAAFTALSHDVYNAEPFTIDLTTSPMRQRHGNYAQDDAFKMRTVESDSMNLAQTNNLLHMLIASDGENNPQSQVDRLFNEMHRVVRPGGHIILRELASGLDIREHPNYSSEASRVRFEQFKQEVFDGLAQAGFQSITMEPATTIRGVDYLFDPTRNFAQYPTDDNPAAIVVSATNS